MKVVKHVQVGERRYFFMEVDQEEIQYSPSSEDIDLPPGAYLTGATSNTADLIKQTVYSIATLIRQGFDSVESPNELTIEFSLSLKGEAAIPIIIRQSTEGTIKITSTWKKV